MKSTILILANSISGLYKFRKELLERLISDGYEVYVSVPNGEFKQQIIDIGCAYIETDIDRRGINPFRDLELILNYFKMINNVKPNLVITYTIKPNLYGGIVSRIKNIPYAINITGLGTAFQKGNLLRKIIIKMYKFTSKKSKVIFFENIENRDFFIKEKIVEADRTCLLNGAGVNLEEFIYKDYPIDKKIKFLFMGRIMAEKGVDELFVSIKKLHSENFNIELNILGGLEENYKAEIEKYKREGWLHYHGIQKDVRPFIENAHCFVLPSWHEGMANTNLESAASGRPIITSDIHGCKEAVIDNVSGYLFECKNVEDLYEKIKKFLKLSYQDKKNMGLAGRKHMEENFDRNKVVKNTIEELNKI